VVICQPVVIPLPAGREKNAAPGGHHAARPSLGERYWLLAASLFTDPSGASHAGGERSSVSHAAWVRLLPLHQQGPGAAGR